MYLILKKNFDFCAMSEWRQTFKIFPLFPSSYFCECIEIDLLHISYFTTNMRMIICHYLVNDVIFSNINEL